MFGFFSPPSRDQAIALAGVFQACDLVVKLANDGICSQADFATSIHSLFERNPDSTEAVFGGIGGIRPGIDVLLQVLNSPKSAHNTALLRHVMGVMHLQRKLLGNRAMLDRVATGIENARAQAEHFGETHGNVIANLADLYQQTISTFNFRIQVQGDPEYLRQPAIAAKIRCLLFAAIRAAILWHQLGGRRYQLIFNRVNVMSRVSQLRAEG